MQSLSFTNSKRLKGSCNETVDELDIILKLESFVSIYMDLLH